MAGYGTPIESPPPKGKAAVLRTVALGFSTGAEAPQLPPGMSSRGSNFLSLDGGLSLRPGLRLVGNVSSLSSMDNLSWVGEGSTTTGLRVPVALGSAPSRLIGGSWSTLSQTGPSNNTLSGLYTGYRQFDATVYYHPTTDEFELCFVNSQGSGAWTWRPTTDYFSALTNAPQANSVTIFDNRLVFSNVSTGGLQLPQRVAWSARGNPELYTAPDGGFDELLDARGVITRTISDGDRLLVFLDQEIWQGLRAPFPFTFVFTPLDRSKGCAAPRTIVQTPKGTVFLGTDFSLYLIPRGGTPQEIGMNIQRHIRDEIYTNWTAPDTASAHAEYDELRGGYLLLYRTISGTHGLFSDAGGTRGIFVNLDTGTFDPVGIDAGALQFNLTMAMGFTYLPDSTSTTRAFRRILLGQSGLGSPTQRVLEWTSAATWDVGSGPSPTFSLLSSNIEASRLVAIPNPDPTERLYIREARVDYRTTSAASLSLEMTPDFSASIASVTRALALPVAPLSAQTRVGGGVSGIYPAFRIVMSSGHSTAVIQGIAAVVESMGNG